jgi:hypothetical protein
MANFLLRRTDAARFLAQTQMGWFRAVGIANRTDVGYRVVERPLYWNAPLFGEPRPSPNVAYRRQPCTTGNRAKIT